MYLKQRHRRWWAFHDIPKDLRATIGVGVRFHANLDTDDKKTADNRAASLEREWRRQIEAARQTVKGHAGSEAEWWNARLRATGEEGRPHLLERIKEEASEIAGANVGDYRPDDERWESHEAWLKAVGNDPEANRFYEVATGTMVRFADHIDEWASTLARQNEAKSIDMKKSNVAKFAKAFPYVQDVKRRDVQRWINDQVSEHGKSPATIQRMLSELRGYWAYLISVQAAPDEIYPFDKLTLPRTSSKSAAQKKRRAFTEKEVMRLLTAAEKEGDQTLADLIRLGMWTGARIEELSALEVKAVTPTKITIEAAKTPAGIRAVPVHPKLAATIRRLKKASTDGYLLSGLPTNKYGKRAPAIGKRFTRLKRDLGFGPLHVFHSLRHTVISQFQRAGIAEGIAMDIVGHEKPTLTYGRYGKGDTFELQRRALKELTYPGYTAR